MDENFKQLIEELRAEVMEKITDTTDRCRCMCLGALESAEDNLDVPQSRITISRAIQTVRRLLKNHLRFNQPK